jgi:hypothetical protein
VTSLRAGQSVVRFPLDTLIYLLPTTSKPAVGSASRQPPGTLKRWGRKADHAPSSSAHFTSEWSYISESPQAFTSCTGTNLSLTFVTLHYISSKPTKLQTCCRRVLLAKLIVAQLVHKSLPLFATVRYITVFTRIYTSLSESNESITLHCVSVVLPSIQRVSCGLFWFSDG